MNHSSGVGSGLAAGKARTPVPPALARLPLVGRATELAQLHAELERARAGRTAMVLLGGDPGVGKSRLASVTADEARHGGWTVAFGRAYRMESGAPYALFSDAFVPLLRDLDPGRLSVLARGAQAQLERLFPALGYGREPTAATTPVDRSQLFWTFAEVLRGLSERQPLLIVLDDLHWADVSSLELLHFLARQLTQQRIALIATVNDAEKMGHATLGSTVQSLHALGALRQHRVEPLSWEDTDELVRQVFGIDERVSRAFTALLFGWTRGNPYFIEETLKTLVESGRLRTQGGSWLGWEVAELGLPGSVRDAIRLRLGRLSPSALQVAELLAVLGARAPYDALRSLCGLEEGELVRALEELGGAQVVQEGGSTREPLYDFVHPMVAQTLHSGIALARRRIMHAAIAEALEKRYGERAGEHSDELARHFARGDAQQLTPKAVKYLAAAGRSALARFANQEAADYLTAALERLDAQGVADATGGTPDGERDPFRVLADLARARLRLGEVGEAMRLLERARGAAEAAGDRARVAAVLRRIGLAHFRAGSHTEALEAFGGALAAISEGAESPRPTSVASLAVRTRIVRGVCLQAVGRAEDARHDLETALADSERLGDSTLRARSHRALLLFYGLAGPTDKARAHGRSAIALAEASGDKGLAASCHSSMAVLEGLTGHGEAIDFHIRESGRIAEELNSPLLRLSADEIQVEYAYGRGDWDTGLAIGERAIALARALNQRGLLPRLLVWTAFIHLGRDEQETAKSYLDEAWMLSGAEDLTRMADVHNMVAAHIGMAAYHATRWECDEAIRIGRRGLTIVDRAGYTSWAVHRLLPIIVESQLIAEDIPGARETLARLRREAQALDHPLGLAWADTGEAIATYLDGDVPGSIPMLREAAERLERVPYLPDAARLRRQFAARLVEVGERDAAIRELRRVHEIFVRLGAQTELEKTRIQLQELGARPPSRSAGGATETLTDREVEIVRLVSEHMSNKAIGKMLGISPRTVGTHLSNIYGKLEIATRAELASRALVILSGPRPT